MSDFCGSPEVVESAKEVENGIKKFSFVNRDLRLLPYLYTY